MNTTAAMLRRPLSSFGSAGVYVLRKQGKQQLRRQRPLALFSTAAASGRGAATSTGVGEAVQQQQGGGGGLGMVGL